MTKSRRCSVFLLAMLLFASVPDIPASSQGADRHSISGFPIVMQMPELPTGCEVTALTMAMRYYGHNVSKTAMASRYLPKAAPYFYWGSDGKLYGPDMEKNFVGSPFDAEGYICGIPALCTAADGYFKENKINMRAKDVSGYTPQQLYGLIEQDVPVVVLTTIELVDRQEDFGWYSPEGKRMGLCYNDHGAVLIGYTPTTVILADPWRAVSSTAAAALSPCSGQGAGSA